MRRFLRPTLRLPAPRRRLPIPTSPLLIADFFRKDNYKKYRRKNKNLPASTCSQRIAVVSLDYLLLPLVGIFYTMPAKQLA